MNLNDYLHKEEEITEEMGVSTARKKISNLPEFQQIPKIKGLDNKYNQFSKYDASAVRSHLQEYNSKVKRYNELKSKLGKTGDPTIGGKGTALKDAEVADAVKEMKSLAKEISKKRNDLSPMIKDLASAVSKYETAEAQKKAATNKKIKSGEKTKAFKERVSSILDSLKKKKGA